MKKLLIVMVAALALVAASAMTAAAADWNFYGSARVSSFYVGVEITEKERVYNNPALGVHANSRIGANVTVSDELTAQFEYGAGVNSVRILWGEWDFGNGSLGFGQHYTPMQLFYSNQAYGSDNGLLAQGGVYSGLQPMIRLKYGDFEIAATTVNVSHTLTGEDSGTTVIDVDFPAIEAAYNVKVGAYSGSLVGGVQAYEVSLTQAEDALTYDILSYVAAMGGKVSFGTGYVGGNVYIGQNVGHLMALSLDGDNTWNDGFADFTIADGTVTDNGTTGFLVAGGFKLNDRYTFEAGYGSAFTSVLTDDDEEDGEENRVQTFYVQSVITLAPGLYLIPEFGHFNGMEKDVEGNVRTTYYGAKWQINF